MPNWCYTKVCFRGKPENITNLRNDILLAEEFNKQYGSLWCNIRYLLSLKGFDNASYYQRFPNDSAPNFRGYVHDSILTEEKDGDYLLYYPTFEMAWDTDYEVLQIISMLYGVEFSAYSEEPGMDIRHKCRNGDIDECDFDYTIIPNYEQYENALGQDPELDNDISYDNPVKQGSEDQKVILDILKDLGIEYRVERIPEVPVPTPYGVYYHYIYGVAYDTDTFKTFYDYPELDRFNIINKNKL